MEDLNRILIQHPSATFFMRVKNERMNELICPGDVLVVDRALAAKPGHVIVVTIDGDFFIGELAEEGSRFQLLARNPAFKTLEIGDESCIWGVVAHVVRTLLPR